MNEVEIVGRDHEVRTVTTLVERASQGGAALLIRGEPGIGKSVLLDAARRSAAVAGHTVLSTAGVESEATLGYAGLHRLLRPLLGRIDVLDPIPAGALRAAVGLGDDARGEPFLVAVATLDLLTVSAEAVPLVIVADDLHWLDAASRSVLATVAGHLEGRRMAMLLAIRDGYEATRAEFELDELTLSGIDRHAAGRLLDGRGTLPAAVRERLLGEANGNPLALIELPAHGTAEAVRTAEAPIVPLSARLEQAFASRLCEVPSATRCLLLLAAADDASSVGDVLAAAEVLGETLTLDDFLPAVDVGLVGLKDGSIHFRHPLVRSAVYQAASIEARLASHDALAEVVQSDPDRRAWHRAAATVTRDDAVAEEVDAAGLRAHARGAVFEAALTFARAARLTDAVEPRAARWLQSAELAFQAGRPDLVRDAIVEARRLTLNPRDRARADLLAESFHDGVVGDVDRVARLVDEAREVAALGDTDLALELIRGAAVRCWWGGLETAERARVVAAAELLPVSPLEPRLLAAIACAAPLERGAEVVGRVRLALTDRAGDLLGRWFLAMAAHAAGDHKLSLSILTELVPELRSHGRYGLLTQALSMMQWDAALLGEWQLTELAAAEGDRLADDTGQRIWGAGITCGLAAAAAVRGESARADELASAAEGVIVPHRLADMHSVLLAARGIAAVSAGRYDDAYAILRRAFDPEDRAFHYRERFGALAYLAEAARECGNENEARAIIASLAALASRGAAPALRESIRFAEALLGQDFDLNRANDAQLSAFDLGRVCLARAEAFTNRGELEDAYRMLELARSEFAAAGAASWRARAEEVLAGVAAGA